jgi:hypothetical protein
MVFVFAARFIRGLDGDGFFEVHDWPWPGGLEQRQKSPPQAGRFDAGETFWTELRASLNRDAAFGAVHGH